jgi:hypothetical protein
VGTPQEALKILTPAPKKAKKALLDHTNTQLPSKPVFSPKKAESVSIVPSEGAPARPAPSQVTNLYVNKMVEGLNCIGDAIMCRSCCNSNVQDEEFRQQLDNMTIAVQPDKINPAPKTASTAIVEHDL